MKYKRTPYPLGTPLWHVACSSRGPQPNIYTTIFQHPLRELHLVSAEEDRLTDRMNKLLERLQKDPDISTSKRALSCESISVPFRILRPTPVGQ